jgi:hypothetical protein
MNQLASIMRPNKSCTGAAGPVFYWKPRSDGGPVNSDVRHLRVLKAGEIMKVLLRWLLLILLPTLASVKLQAPFQKPIVIAGVTIIDVKSGRSTADMTIHHGQSYCCARQDRKVSLPADAQEIDASGKYLIPGLWDMHVHLGERERARHAAPDRQRRDRCSRAFTLLQYLR